MEMKHWKQFVLGSVLVALTIICLISLSTTSGSSTPRPREAQPGEAHTLCATAWCQAWESYTIMMDTPALIQFYESNGYACTQIKTPYDAGQFTVFPLPYWQCVTKRPYQGSIYIGFREPDINKQILVRIYMSWDPDNCGAARIC